jgi:hypothetical protein
MKPRSLVLCCVCSLSACAAFGADWQIVASPNSGNQPNSLNAVAAVAENDVWAVGASSSSDSFSSRTLIEHWNGTGWSVVRSPNPGATFNVLTAVAVVSANNLWAAGYSANNTTYSTLVEHWNGTKWTVVPSPNGFNGAPQFNFLSGIAVVSAHDIWVVGSFFNDEDNTLTLHWDGSTWSVVPSPNGGLETNNGLSAVTAIAANDVWAVGSFQSEAVGAEARTLTLHWNGTAWSIVPSANDGVEGNFLHGIAAVSSSDIWAVGRVENVDTLALHWNGAAWSVVSTPAIADSGFADLRSAVALSTDAVWTAGSFFQNTFSRDRTLTELWNGSAWSIVRSPNRGGLHNDLNAIDATPNGTLWAVGFQYNSAGVQRTLTLRMLP